MEGQDSKDLYDICIVGAGIMGSAAARHTTLIAPSLKVCLIGPKEPKILTECQHGIFSAHYDEGRIATPFSPYYYWSELAARSIQRYREVEKISGVKFYHEGKFLFVASPNDPTLQKAKENGRNVNNSLFHFETIIDISKVFPFLSSKPGLEGFLLSGEGGHVSSRSEVIAQQTAAHLHRCHIIDDVVDQVIEKSQSDGSKSMEVTTAKGQVILARKVLLSPGAFTAFRDLLPQGKELDVKLLPQTVAFVEVTDEDVLRLKDMPSIGWKPYIEEINWYILPPIKYPNGKYYIKIGVRGKTELLTAAEVGDLYKKECNKSTYQPLLDILFDVVKGINPVSTHGECAVTTHTPTSLPYCDMVTPTLGVVVAGNGYAATSGDEIGRMAARMIIAGHWDHDFPQEQFKVRFKMLQ
ncbi:uncharacterized protein LOC144446844 [Glandiceps talaboti]